MRLFLSRESKKKYTTSCFTYPKLNAQKTTVITSYAAADHKRGSMRNCIATDKKGISMIFLTVNRSGHKVWRCKHDNFGMMDDMTRHNCHSYSLHNIILLTGNKSFHIPVHSMYALPVVPGGQMHLGWWSLPMQTAVSAHVSLSQTSRHTLFSLSQASSSAQSSLYWHTTETQDSRGFPCVPGGHTHCARWAWT